MIPEFGGGRPSKLTEEQKETKEVQGLIEEEFGVKYSSWRVGRVLKAGS